MRTLSIFQRIVVVFSLFIAILPTSPASAADEEEIPFFTQITSGYKYSCALTKLGQVYCWGDNTFSQLGRQEVDNLPNPGKVLNLPKAILISSGYRHTCAILEDKRVMCWGENSFGQVGDGQVNTDLRFFPVFVHNVFNASQIALGESHTCVLTEDGTVKCWGKNTRGQVGIGNNSTTLIPTVVPLPNPVLGLAVGSNHSCAVDIQGQVFCWGSNEFGQLGTGSMNDSNTPVMITSIAAQTKIVSGYNATCSGDSAGVFRCWGSGENGNLGNGEIVNQSAPVTVGSGADKSSLAIGLNGVLDFSLGSIHSCLIDKNSDAWCWGKAGSNLLGWGDTAIPNSYPRSSYVVYRSGINPIMSNAVDIAAGFDHSCVLRRDGSVYCWGSNRAGQVGVGNSTPSSFGPSVITPASVSRAALNGWFAPVSNLVGTVVDDRITLSWSRDLTDYNFNIPGILSTSALNSRVEIKSDIDSLSCSAILLTNCSVGPLKPSTTYVFSARVTNSLGKSPTTKLTITTDSVASAVEKARIAAEAAARAKAEAEAAATAKAEAEAKAKLEAEARAIAEAEAKAKADAESAARAKAEAEAKAARQQSIVVNQPSIQKMSGVYLELNAATTSGLRIGVISQTPEICKGVSGLYPFVVFLQPGKCSLLLSQSGNTLFDSANPVTVTFDQIEDRKQTTITCVQGKETQKVTGYRPQCPVGFLPKSRS